jgi:ABC-type bacteriocin/lantibiotic exporter with double-glycine peptidase domain
MSKRRSVVALLSGLGFIVAWTLRIPLTSRAGAFALGATYLGDSAVRRQRSFEDCGVAALHMMFDTYRRPFPRQMDDSLLRVVHTRGFGLSFAEMAHLAGERGLAASGYIMDLDALGRAPLPVIAHLKRHFVVVDGITSTTVFIRDPVFGRLSLPQSRFLKEWTGRVLVVSTMTPAIQAGVHEAHAERSGE